MDTLRPRIPEFDIRLKYKLNKGEELIKISSSKDIADVARRCFDADKIDWVESVMVIALNQANYVVGFYKVSQGGITGTVCDTRVVFQFALLANATKIILSHNHPSGTNEPSENDRRLTRKLQEAGEVMDIKLLDHVIITKTGYYSFMDSGGI